MLTNDNVSFEQLGPGLRNFTLKFKAEDFKKAISPKLLYGATSYLAWAQLFKANNIVNLRFVKIYIE